MIVVYWLHGCMLYCVLSFRNVLHAGVYLKFSIHFLMLQPFCYNFSVANTICTQTMHEWLAAWLAGDCSTVAISFILSLSLSLSVSTEVNRVYCVGKMYEMWNKFVWVLQFYLYSSFSFYYHINIYFSFMVIASEMRIVSLRFSVYICTFHLKIVELFAHYFSVFLFFI